MSAVAAPPVTSTRRRPDGYVVAVGLLLALFASATLHATLIWSSLRGPATADGGGEDGLAGAGDATIDISVAGPAAPTPSRPLPIPTPVTPPAPVPPPVVEPSAPDPSTPAATPVSRPRPRVEPRPDAPTPDPPDAPATTTAPEGTPEHPTAPDTAVSGTGADTTSGGRAPGPSADALRALILGLAGEAPDGVDSQRALLPAAMTCEDPVAGTWRAFKYSPLQGSWVRFTLVIHHRADGRLDGTITSRIWSGDASDRVPPPCSPGQHDVTTRMPAFGRVDDRGRITFGSNTSETVAVHCPDSLSGYAPDNFSGTIDSMRQEFQSVNNDGAYDINAPYVFRRTGCLDE